MDDVLQMATSNEFFEFLERRASALESAFFDTEQSACGREKPGDNMQISVQKNNAGPSMPRVTTALRCPLCKDPHPPYCQGEFLELSVPVGSYV